MIDYTLAKRLKEAGFPQRERVNFKSGFTGYVGYGLGFLYDDGTYSPTLEELIEACGDRFYKLVKENGHLDYKFGEWHVYSTEEDDIYAKTPSEAVANLWLALNEKKKHD